MNLDIYDAIVKAAGEAWTTGEVVPVEGYPILVMPEQAMDAMARFVASRNLRLREPDLPTLWIEHRGQRAQVAWHTGPPIEPGKG
jgi:hypothetical protein